MNQNSYKDQLLSDNYLLGLSHSVKTGKRKLTLLLISVLDLKVNGFI